jgi:hypothetical protein
VRCSQRSLYPVNPPHYRQQRQRTARLRSADAANHDCISGALHEAWNRIMLHGPRLARPTSYHPLHAANIWACAPETTYMCFSSFPSVLSHLNMSKFDNAGTSAGFLPTPRRVVLRFATASAPENDEDVYRPFLAQENVDHQDYYVHIQPRDYDRTHIVIDFCESSSLPIDCIPHQVYRVTWKDIIPYVFISKHIEEYGHLTKSSNYEEMNDQWTKKARDLTSVYRWFR